MISGRYSLDREIGRGGMGAVWLGRDEVLGRAVALKRIGLLAGAASPDFDRAEREARLAARLNHPHVVAVFDLVREGSEQWLVMEYVEGSTLSELIKESGSLSPDQVSPIIGQAADALAAAHAAGIVHRDVKPSNILVTPGGQVKLSDFGIARAQADASLTQTGLVTGSPAYLAPEVASGKGATSASDSWSLGATVFHALAGHPPYDVGDNLLGALYRIVHEEPPRITDAGWLTSLLDHTMTRDPRQRWDMAQVRAFLDAGPTAAVVRPMTGRPMTGRRSRRAASTSDQAEGTQVLAAVPAVVATQPPATPTDGTATTPDATAPHRRRRRPGLWLAVLAAVAVLAVLTVIGFAIGFGGDDGSQGSAGGAGASPSASPSASDEPPAPTAEAMDAFVSNYLATATADPDAGFAMLTPDYQKASGGIAGYTNAFWGNVTSTRLEGVESDPDALTVTYDYEYTLNSGEVQPDTVSLRLEYSNGTYLIDGEAP